MRTALLILRRDVRRLLRNPVATIVTIGVILIPSLYAWFNILANWDPYENTSTVSIAVVNEDEGADVGDLGNINAGDMIVERLEDNEQLGWTFVSEDEALEGVRSGKYYAAFVIPDDFTSSLSDVLDGDTEKAHIGYYVNEKANAIAPRVTDTGATTIENQVSNEFVNVCAETISEKVKTGTADVAKGIDATVRDTASGLREVQSNITSLANDMDNLQGTVKQARSTVASARKTLKSLSGSTDSLASRLDKALDSLSETREETQTLAATLANALGEDSRTIAGISSKANYAVGTAAGDIGWATGKLDAAIEQIEGSATTVQALAKTLTDARDALLAMQITDATAAAARDALVSQINSALGALQAIAQKQAAAIAPLKQLSQDIKDGTADVQNLSETVNKAIQDSATTMGDLQAELVSTTIPSMSSALDGFADVGGRIVGISDSLVPMLDQADGSLAQLDTTLEQIGTTTKTTVGSLHSAAKKVGSLADDVAAVQSAETFSGINELLDMDPESVGDFMGSPVTIRDEAVYEVANYGSGVAPFYTNLALWVGGFVMLAIYKVEVDDEGIGEFKPWQGYVGRWMLYVIIGLLQALVCCLGDLALGIQCLSPVAFVAAGLLESFVYDALLFALAISFKHIGKALGVVLVVLQIPGASGLYPIEMMPGFFQAIHPLLPFTYGINAMREAIAGFYANDYAINMGILLVYLIPAFLIGLVARRHLLNLNALFDRKLAETDLMISERANMDGARFKLSTIIKALADSKEYKRTFTERAAGFELAYPVLVRRGFLALAFVPLLLLALLFLLPMKMLMLTIWILSLVGICTYLIVIEYLHDRVTEKTRMADMSREELYDLLGRGLREEYMAFAPLDKMRLDGGSPLTRFARRDDDEAEATATEEGDPKGGDAR